MTATDELRALLDERGVEWEDFDGEPTWAGGDGRMYYARQEFTFAGLTGNVTVYHLTPAQAIAATLGLGTCRKVYLVETSDDLLESWYPIAVYLHRESAEDCAEALRKEEDGIRQFARVSELMVVDG